MFRVVSFLVIGFLWGFCAFLFWGTFFVFTLWFFGCLGWVGLSFYLFVCLFYFGLYLDLSVKQTLLIVVLS